MTAMLKLFARPFLPPPSGKVYDAPETRAFVELHRDRQTVPPALSLPAVSLSNLSNGPFPLAREAADHPACSPSSVLRSSEFPAPNCPAGACPEFYRRARGH